MPMYVPEIKSMNLSVKMTPIVGLELALWE